VTSIPTAASTAPAAWPADADQPIGYTLTPKALAAVGTGPAGEIPPGEWACRTCGAAYFGTAPETGQCPGCTPRIAAAPPASALRALCDPCRAAFASIHARARQAASGALSAVESLF
jgi:hypothetical protein